MTTNHKELCERLRTEIEAFKKAGVNPGELVPALARIEELEKERDALKADADRYFFLKRQAQYDPKMDGRHVWYNIPMRNPNGGCLIGNTLDAAVDAALQAEKETRS